jgi:hypothetical protein
MKKNIILFIVLFLKMSAVFGQIGINTTSPHPSAALDITSTNKGLLIPRMTLSERDLITATNGLLIYCTDCNPKGVYIYNNIWSALVLDSKDADATTKGVVKLAGDLTGIATAPNISNESITTSKIADASVTAPKIVAETGGLNNQFLSTNNSSMLQWTGIPFTKSYTVSGPVVEIRGNGNNIEDAFEVPYYTSSVTLARGRYMFVNKNSIAQLPKTNASDVYGNSVWIDVLSDSGYVTSYGSAQIGFLDIYRYCSAGQVFIFEVLSNTADVKFRYKPCDSNKNQCAFKMAGAFSANIYQLNSSEILPAVSTINPQVNCDQNGFSGLLINGAASTSSNTYSVTITNPSSFDINLNFSTSDLALSGITGMAVSTVSPSFTVLPSGGSAIITYYLSGTPGASGTLTGQWNKLGLTCTKTMEVINSGAYFTFPQNQYIGSMLFSSPIVVNEQGIIDNTTNKITINIPYTSASSNFSYPAFTSSAITASLGEGDDLNTFTYSYPAGNIVTTGGTVPVTINVNEDGTYNVKKQTVANGEQNIASLTFTLNGVSYGSINLIALGGIRDRMYDKLDKSGNYSHQMVYFPVTGADGKKWLNNNLGANYATVGKPNYAPLQQATSKDDSNAFGSLFQWGRSPDGHELMNWPTAVNGTTSSNPGADIAANALFIIAGSATNYDWRGATQNDNLWQGESGTNNPCPVGYRVPSTTELGNLYDSSGISNSATAASTTLKFTVPGRRVNSSGTLSNTYVEGVYWSSTVSGTNAIGRGFNDSGRTTFTIGRAWGSSVRCIKN